MKILIEIPYSTKLLIGASQNSGALLQALTEAVLVETEGYGKDLKWKHVDPSKVISLEMKPDNFMDALQPHDPIAVLKAENELADKRWLEYYHKTASLEKQLKELCADLDARGITYKKDEPK